MKNYKHTKTNTNTHTNVRADAGDGAGTARPHKISHLPVPPGTSRPRPNTTLNRNKRQFVEAVELMAPGNKFIADVARRVPQDMLPAIAGVAAFELASTLELLCKSWRLRRPLEPARTFRRRPSPLTDIQNPESRIQSPTH